MTTTPSVSPPSTLPFPVIGLGASAGGIEALLIFFQQMPANSGMAFVIVLHLSAGQVSHVAEVIQQATAMPVLQVTAATPIEVNHVYVIAPSLDLSMVDGHLKVAAATRTDGPPNAVDVFFRALAEAHGTRAFCVVLSGTGADGSLGLKRVKEVGGVTLAQTPDDAQYDGMPQSAIATGMVDIVLPVAEMPQRLLDLWDNVQAIRMQANRMRSAQPDGGPDGRDAETAEQVLQEIITMLRTRTSHDFSNYKRATILRRIERRLQVNSTRDIASYRDFLHAHPEETPALLQDILISVTRFFRDGDGFAALEKDVLPGLFRDRPDGEDVRVWSAGCATGEEAYSLAILLDEASTAAGRKQGYQLFATDIDERAVGLARAGRYPETVAADMSAARLSQFFRKEPGHYRLRKELRDRILFAIHNVLSDPPFSRLDLVCCRNLLIYLDRDAQADVLRIFHFALRAGGYLFLGVSETVEAAGALFTVVDKKHRLYRANSTIGPGHVMRATTAGAGGPRPVVTPVQPAARRRRPFADIHRRMLEQFASPSVLVTSGSEIVHLSDGAGRFLRYAAGEPSHNLISVVSPELQLPLRTAIFQALQGNRSVESPRVRISHDGGSFYVSMTARAVHDPESNAEFLLVTFNEVEDMLAHGVPAGTDAGRDPLTIQLERELHLTREQLRATIEQGEMSTEELRASNEELQAINEELRSTSEELETSKEELQSINEELSTVNAELQSKVEETVQISDDLQNLITSSDICTIFVDRSMRIRRYTPRAAAIFNVIPSDLGRSLLDLSHRLDYPELAKDAEASFVSLRRHEREVKTVDGRWYLARFTPYRTAEDLIDGTVLAFIDITERRETEERLRENERHTLVAAETTREYAIIALDDDGLVLSWNAGAARMFGFSDVEIIRRPFSTLFTSEDCERGVPEEEIRLALRHGRVEEERWHVRKDGTRFYCSGVLSRIDSNGITGFAKITREVAAPVSLPANGSGPI